MIVKRILRKITPELIGWIATFAVIIVGILVVVFYYPR